MQPPPLDAELVEKLVWAQRLLATRFTGEEVPVLVQYLVRAISDENKLRAMAILLQLAQDLNATALADDAATGNLETRDPKGTQAH